MPETNIDNNGKALANLSQERKNSWIKLTCLTMVKTKFSMPNKG